MLLTTLVLLAAAQLRTPVPAPATILHVTSLGPAAGNGLGPKIAALDPVTRRLFVVNEVTRNISVVDLKRRRVSAVIPLGEGWSFENRTRILVDPSSERVFITGPEVPGYRRSRIIAVSTRTLKVEASRTVEGTLIADAVVLPQRHELFTSAWRNTRGGGWGIDVFDTRTLAPLRRIPISAEIVAMAADPKRNRLYTAEPDAEFNNGLGTMGKWGYGSVRVISRDPASGDTCGHSEKITGLMDVLVDGEGGRLIIPHGDGPATGQGHVVTILDGCDLARRRTVAFRIPERQEGKRLPFNSIAYDRYGDRLLAKLDHGNGCASLDLRTGAVRAGPDPRTTLADYAGPLDGTGRQLIWVVDNGIVAISLESLTPAWSLPLGAEVARVFADRGHGRALAVTSQQEAVVRWVGEKSGTGVRLPVPWNNGFDEILSVDFTRRRVYYTLPTIHGGGGYLARMNFGGKTERDYTQPMPAHLYQIALSPNGTKSYRGFIEFASEGDAWVGIYESDRLVRKVPVPSRPRRFAYAAAADMLYLVYPGELRTLEGRTIPLPRTAAGDEQTFPVDVSADGSRAYHADPKTRVLSTIRTSDGAVVAQRLLPFAPTDISVDSSAETTYVVDGMGGRVAIVRLPDSGP